MNIWNSCLGFLNCKFSFHYQCVEHLKHMRSTYCKLICVRKLSLMHLEDCSLKWQCMYLVSYAVKMTHIGQSFYWFYYKFTYHKYFSYPKVTLCKLSRVFINYSQYSLLQHKNTWALEKKSEQWFQKSLIIKWKKKRFKCESEMWWKFIC